MNRTMRVVHLLAASAALAACSVAQAPAPARAPLPRPDSAQLIRDLFVLAADSMEGRRVGTAGGAKARAYLKARLNAIGIAPLKDSLAMPFASAGRGGDTTRGVNLVGIVRGTKTPDAYIVLAAHYDHLGVRDGTVYPGADDNASGTAAVLAIAAWLKRNPPAHSVIVALWDGEEGGLRGARAFVAAPPVPLEKIIANVNLDMVSRNDRNELYAAGATPNPQMKPLLDALVAVAPVTLKLGHDSGTGQDNWTRGRCRGSTSVSRTTPTTTSRPTFPTGFRRAFTIGSCRPSPNS
jgi:hypothetical protein